MSSVVSAPPSVPIRSADSVAVGAIARAVLYEGYKLYPYRKSSLKNRRPVLFGTLLPREWVLAHPETNDAWEAQMECVLDLRRRKNESLRVVITIRFLALTDPPEEVTIAATLTDGWGEHFEETTGSAHTIAQWRGTSIPGVLRVRVKVQNVAAFSAASSREEAERAGLGAAHVLVSVMSPLCFVSTIDPPTDLATIAADCTQVGLWPVLIGPDDTRMLASPIILEDHPRIAPESRAGDLFDATEIEEILALRIMTLSDDEKAEILRSSDTKTRALLERVDALSPADLDRVHGVLRLTSTSSSPSSSGRIAVGDRVKLKPRERTATERSDAFDVLLAGMEATVVSIERTFENEELVCVTIDRDPGRDLGERGFPGHRFFFRPDEMEVVPR